MGFGHESLHVYRAVIEYVGWAHQGCAHLKGDHYIRTGDSEFDPDADSDSE